MSWWYCLVHGRVEEGDKGCAHSECLGPFETQEDAAHALELARQRNDEWSASDDEWERGKPKKL